ncbi:MAG: hypothetical protein ACI9KR_000280 [Arcticibacterium sp.]|jgi:hypothetical protein|tara:strand:- start:214 stop:507 length:294 start_codon:yes stop_codon:yes gene_type:complete
MSRKDSPQQLSEALDRFISANKLEKGLDKVNAQKAWENIMGNGVNSYTREVRLERGILYVSLSSAVLREELSHGKSKIVSMLNEALGKDLVQKVVLR